MPVSPNLANGKTGRSGTSASNYLTAWSGLVNSQAVDLLVKFVRSPFAGTHGLAAQLFGNAVMKKAPFGIVAVVLLMLFPGTGLAQVAKTPNRVAPMKSSDQRQDKRNTVPLQFKTEVIAVDNAGRARAEQIIEVDEMLASKPTLENIHR